MNSNRSCRAGILKDATVSWYDLRSLQELVLVTGEHNNGKDPYLASIKPPVALTGYLRR